MVRQILVYCVAALVIGACTGCQLIMEELETKDAGADAGSDAGTEPDADASDAIPSADAAGGDATEDTGQLDAEPNSDAMQPDADTGVQTESSVPQPDPDACDGTGENYFYRDSDQDGHGDPSMPRIACMAPSGYVDNDGDCNDRNADVHPGQTAFFPDPYRLDATADSFDYDCNGRELGAPGSQPGTPCTGGGLLACSGGGYEPNPDRADMTDVNPYCGSAVILECPNILPPLTGGCGGETVTTSSRFLCN